MCKYSYIVLCPSACFGVWFGKALHKAGGSVGIGQLSVTLFKGFGTKKTMAAAGYCR